MENILITGGAGFIGANLIKKLVLDSNLKVFIIEKENANLWRLKNVLKEINVRYVDLEDSDKLSEVINDIKPNIIFHLASYGLYSSFQTDLEKMINTNIKGSLNLINSLKNLPFTQFVNTGTCIEYKEKESSLNEDDPVDPLNFYGITKLTAELLLKKIGQDNNMSVINLRLFTPYGYYGDSGILIPYIILNALKDKKIELSSPDSVRDFIFIDDLINLFLKIIEDGHNYRGEIFNIGSGKQRSIKEVVSVVEKILGKKLNISYGERMSHYREPKVFQADNKKAQNTFDWKINHDFESGILKTINWFKDNLSLYEKKES